MIRLAKIENRKEVTGVYRIAVLSNNQDTGQQLAHWTKEYYGADGIYPKIDVYHDREQFYQDWKAQSPCAVIVDLPGVTGLNEVEHIRSLGSKCGLIWCSDLDFSLHAFRIRAEYFMKAPFRRDDLEQGLSTLMARRRTRISRSERVGT